MPAIPSIGISTCKCRPDLSDLPAQLDEMAGLGVDRVELGTFDMDLVWGGRIVPSQLERLTKACAGRPFGYTVHGPLAINFMDEAERLARHFEVLKASLDVAAAVGARHYVMHTGFRPLAPADIVEAAYARQRDWLARAGELAGDLGIVICVENVYDWTWGKLEMATPARLARELEAIANPAVRATLDVSHAHLDAAFRGFDLMAELKALAPYAKHVHMHDSFGLSDESYMYTESERLAFGHGDLHLPVGRGSIAWDAIFAECTFPRNTVLNIELDARYWHFAPECIAETRRLAERIRLANA
jgi:sugar phosphate isomerase/epimerase